MMNRAHFGSLLSKSIWPLFLGGLLFLLLVSFIHIATTAVSPSPLLAAPQTAVAADPVVSLALFNDQLNIPSDVTNTGVSGDERLFIAQQGGVIRILDTNGALLPDPFLSISVKFFGESGLLGLAFDPNYDENGYFYVNYVKNLSGDPNVPGETHISRFTVSDSNPNIADPNSELVLLTIPQPREGHNGGGLAFGPDGYLYIALGDGGLTEGQHAPPTEPQDTAQLLGKILRIDVAQSGSHAPDCGDAGYTIPEDNPLRDGSGGSCDEIWAYGLRNPWRISFDRETGDLFIADVGQSNWEEVNFQPAASPGGQNYGWPCYEGDQVYNNSGCNPDVNLYQFPVFQYGHGSPDFHCSITGGFVYRGQQFPFLVGHYLFADLCSGHVWTLAQTNGGWTAVSQGALIDSVGPTTFGEDIHGELYVSDHNGGKNASLLYRVEENTVGPNLSITKTGPASVLVAEPFRYELSITNSGSGDAVNLTITDTLPLGATYVSSSDGGTIAGETVTWQVASLAAGNTLTRTLTVSAAAAGALINDAYGVTSEAGFGAVGSTAVTTTVNPAPNLTIGKTGPGAVAAGELITYTITANNQTGVTLNNVLITDTLPLNTSFVASSHSGIPFSGVVSWNLAPIASSEQVSVTLTVMPAEAGTQVVRNETYGISTDGGYAALGQRPVVTIVDGESTFLPTVQR